MLKAHRKYIYAALVALAFAVSDVFAAAAVTLSNTKGALFANAGTHYELSAEGGEEAITFEVTVTGIPEGSELFFRTSTVKSDCIQSVFPTRSNLADGVPSSVSIRLRPNRTGVDASGIVLLTYEYTDGIEPPPKATELRITQHSAEVVAAEPETAREDELAVVSMLESPQNMPDIAFSGDSAELTYTASAGIVSWSTQVTAARLTITDVSVLVRDTPLVVEGYQPTVNGLLSKNKYDVIIPVQQINYILSRRADEILSGLPDKTPLVEDTQLSGDSDIFLRAASVVRLPPGAAIYSEEPFISIPDDNALEFAIDAAWLADAVGSDFDFYADLSYNGVPASGKAFFSVELSNPELYPGVMRALGGDVTEPDTPAAVDTVTEPEPPPDEIKQRYNPQRGEFIYELYGAESFTSSIPNGLITNGPVIMSFSSGVEHTAFLDDEPVLLPSGTQITHPGSYRVIVRATETIVDESELRASEITLEDLQNIQDLDLSAINEPSDVIVHEMVFTFRIVSGMTNSLVFYNPPPGYRISGLKYGNMPVSNFSSNYVHLTADGLYEFTVSGEPGQPEFVTTLERFTGRPVISLIGVQNGMSTSAEVSFDAASGGSDIERIDVSLNGAAVLAYNKTVSAPGLYRITATDAAGNSSSVTFRILYSVNVSGWLLVGIVIAVIGGLYGYMYYLRTHMQVI